MIGMEKTKVQQGTTGLGELTEGLDETPTTLWRYTGSGTWISSDGRVDVCRYFYDGEESYSFGGESPEGHIGKHYAVGHFDEAGDWHDCDFYKTIEGAFVDAKKFHAQLMAESKA